MAPRFDADRSTLELAVADLLDVQLLRSLGFAQRGGYERMWLGQAIHSRYQEQALAEDPSYRHEVRVEHSFDHRGFKVTVKGRIDGLRRDQHGVQVIEEIKSVRRVSQLAPATRELYHRQAAIYAWLLAQNESASPSPLSPSAAPDNTGDAAPTPDEEVSGSHETAVEAVEESVAAPPLPAIRAEVVLIEIGGDEVSREEVQLDLRRLGALIKRRLNALIRNHREQQQAQNARRDAGERLAFPYPSLRGGQQQILDAAEGALERGEHLLIEASTGIGKTVAALYPALASVLQHNRRLFVLTAKNLQQEMATQVLALLNREEAFHSLRLRAKARMCANDQVLCHEEYCSYAKDYYQKLISSQVVERLLEHHATLLPDDVYDHARRAQVCPFEVSLELSGRAQVTVCDYNYAFDPYVALSDFGPEANLGGTILVIDEIHNLVDRGRGYYSPALSARAAVRAAEEVGLGIAPIHRELARLSTELAELVEDAVLELQPPGQSAWAEEQRLPEEQLWRLRPRFDQAFVEYLEYRRETRTLTADDHFVDLYFSLLKFLNALMVADEAFSYYVERDHSGDSKLRILCRDPSRFLGAVLGRCHSVLGLSATLSPPEFYRDLLGFTQDRTEVLRVANPFPPENRRVVVDTSVATTYRERPQNYGPIADGLARFAEEVPGNCLALFPSYQFLAEVGGRVATSHKRVLVQQPSDGEQQRQEILETLRSAIYGDVLLMAVAGGVFAEGVDYPGEMLRAVAVVGPCLPALNLEQRLLQEYYEERFERGFEYAFVVPGMTRVVQAAGRLIRSPEDTGVIALFDRRFLWRPYREHLPVDWLPEEGAKRLAGDPGETARAFFAASPSLQT